MPTINTGTGGYYDYSNWTLDTTSATAGSSYTISSDYVNIGTTTGTQLPDPVEINRIVRDMIAALEVEKERKEEVEFEDDDDSSIDQFLQ